MRAGPTANRGRGGFLLGAVLLIVCILLLLAFTRHFFSRHQLLSADHLGDYERSYHLAASGVEVGRALLERAVAFYDDGRPETFPKRDKAPAALRGILAAFLDGEGLWRREGGRVALDPAVLRDLPGGAPDVQKLTVSLESQPLRPLHTAGAGAGWQPDPREGQARLVVRAEAAVGNAACRVSHIREGRHASILPPVVGKFALFLRRQGSLAVNGVLDSENRALLREVPLQIVAGGGATPDSQTPEALADLLERQGWVFLGGDQPWRLSAGVGGGDAGLQEPLLRRGTFCYPLAPGEPLAVRRCFQYTAAASGFCRELRGVSRQEALLLQPEDEVGRAALLRPCGSAARPTPTLVLGAVTRRWALLQGLRNTGSGKSSLLPWLDEAAFRSESWPGGVSRMGIHTLRGNFGQDHAAYARRMTQPVEEEYNAGLLELLRFPPPAGEGMLLRDPAALPPGCRLPPPSARLLVDGVPAAWHRLAHGRLYELRDEGGEALFTGDLSGLQDLDFLRARAGETFADGAAWLAKRPRDAGGRVAVGGVVGLGRLVLAEPLQLAAGGGGMLVVDGDIRLGAGIDSGAEPLTLVSLSGDIVVETAAPVQAALVALRGRVRLGQGCRLRGPLAAGELVLPPAAPAGTMRELAWDSGFDVTSLTARRRGYRLMLAERGMTCVH